jgi:hypothetical protein
MHGISKSVLKNQSIISTFITGVNRMPLHARFRFSVIKVIGKTYQRFDSGTIVALINIKSQ